MPLIEVVGDDGASWVYFRSPYGDELVLIKPQCDLGTLYGLLEDEGILDVPGVVHADLDPPEGRPIARVDER